MHGKIIPSNENANTHPVGEEWYCKSKVSCQGNIHVPYLFDYKAPIIHSNKCLPLKKTEVHPRN